MIAKGFSEYDLFTIDREEEYRYVDVEGGVKVVGYSGVREYVEIPEMLGGKPVVAIGLAEERDSEQIGRGRTILDEERYLEQIELTILIPNSVTYIDSKSNPLLRRGWYIDLELKPDNENFLIEDDILYAKDKKTLYFGCDPEIKHLVIAEGVEYIGDYAFFEQKFESIKLPKTLKGIGSHAFYDKWSRSILELPSAVEKIGDHIAKNYTIPEENPYYKMVDGCVYTIDEKTLIQCVDSNISQIAIPDTVEVIRSYAFWGKCIKKLDLGNGVQSIGEYAFDSAEIRTIRIPKQLVELADNAFGYEKCNSIRVDKANKHYVSDGICLFSVNDKNEKRLLKCFKSKEEEYVIPEGVVSIADGAFRDCSEMKTIILPDSLQSFSEKCIIGNGYYSCPVKKIEIPKNVSSLDISFLKFDFTIVEENPYYFVENGILYHKKEEGLEIIAAKNVAGELVLKQGVTKIKAHAFELCRKITKIICNSELKIIEHHAFGSGKNEYNITEIRLNEGLTYIDKFAFAVNKTEKIYIPSSVQYICSSAFEDCRKVEFEVDKENLHYASIDGVLYNKAISELKFVPKSKKMKKFEVPSSVVDIGHAFWYCEKITEIVIPEQVTCIWEHSLDCSAKDIYFKGDIRAFHYRGVNLGKGTKLHTDAGSGVVQYVEWVKSLKSDVKITLAINGFEDVSALTKEFDVMLNDTGITILRILEEKEVVNVPEKIGNYAVTKIGSRAFEHKYSNKDIIEEIILPDTVKEIGNYAFADRRKLRSVTLPKGLKRIPKGMFQYCSGLKEVVIPEGVEEVEAAAFFGCEDIKKISFPASVSKISEFFMANEDGTHKDLYLNVSTVFAVEQGSYAEKFLRDYKPDDYVYLCERLKVFYNSQFSNTITETEEEKEALKYLDYSLEEDGTVAVYYKAPWNETHPNVRIPSTIQGMPVTKLKKMESIDCSVETIYIPESVLSIEGLSYLSFYSGGKNMKKIEVAEENPNYWSDGKALYTKDKRILIHMFDYQAESYEVCALTKVIGEGAFGEFSNLKKLVLPEGLEEIQSFAFYSCRNLEEIIGIENVPKVADGVLTSTLYYKKLSVLVTKTVFQKYDETTETSYTVPNGTTEIAKNAFYYYSGEDVLETVILPDSVRIIGASAFFGRSKLRTINIPEGVEKIESKTFSECASLESVLLPSTIKEIAVDAFPIYRDANWRSAAVMPVFSAIEVAPENPVYQSIDGILYSKDGKTLVLVPANFQREEFILPESVEIIGERAFAFNQFIKKVVLTKQVKTISTYAFYGCGNLEEINLESVETIDSAAFSKCEKIKSVTLNLEEIANSAFSECKGLKKLLLNGVKRIGDYAFYKCGIHQLKLQEGLVEVGASAFAGCKLESVVVPKTVLKTGNESFSYCQEITIYDTIDPDAKPCTEYLDDVNGHPNSVVGFIGIGRTRAMWECAANHDWIDHEIIVRSAETDEMKYKVWMGSDIKQRKYYCTLTSSWGKNASFNFEAVDDIFSEIKGVQHKLKVALNRLKYPEMLSEMQKDIYIRYLVRTAKDLVISCIDNNDMETLVFCEPFGVLKKNNIDDFVDYAAKKKAMQFSAYFMEYKNQKFGGSTKKVKMPSLSEKIGESWTVSKSVSNKVGRYKGNEIDIVFPSEVKGKKMTGVAGTTSKVPENYKNLVSVVLPEGYTTIGDYAFYGCVNLEKIVLPSTLETIGKDAFRGCSSLKEIIMPDSVKELGSNVFLDCSSLSNVRFSKKLKRIPEYAFCGCSSLKEIELPRNIDFLDKSSLVIYGLEKIIIHCPNLRSYGKCFGSMPEIYAYEDAVKGVYGVVQRTVKTLHVADMAANTVITVSVTVSGEEKQYSFQLRSTVASIQKIKSESQNNEIKNVKSGKEILEMLKLVYDNDFMNDNNSKEANRLQEEMQADGISFLQITEEKKNEDGEVLTIFTYDFDKNEMSMKYKEMVIGQKSKSSKADKFIDMLAGAKAGADNYFAFDKIDSIDFEGKIFVLTGFNKMEENEITNIIVSKGGEVKASTVVKTNYLVVQEDYDHKTTKYHRAMELKEKGNELYIISSKCFYELSK